MKGKATVDFKVEKAWLTENKLKKENVALYRFVDDKWQELVTTVGEDDGTYIHYSGETPGFSYFVIGEKGTGGAVVEAEAPAAEEVAAGAPAAPTGEAPAAEAPAVGGEAPAAAAGPEVEEKGSSWTIRIIVILLLVVIGVAIFFFFAMRRGNAPRNTP